MVLNAKARIGGRHPTDTCTNPIFSGACSAAADLLGDKAAKSIETACDFIRRRQQKYTPICLLCGGSQIEVSPSVLKPTHDGLTDEEREDDFLSILDACELTGFTPGTALVFENAIERLYYSDSYRIGNATLPQSRVRAKLRRLDGMILREAERKLHENQEQNVKNSTAYTMAVLFNCIAESESDLMVDPYLNALSSTA